MAVLKPNNDPMGSALLDYLEGARGKSIMAHTPAADNDKIPVNYLFRSYEEMPELEQLALQFCEGDILEIGAGAGRHALILKEAEHQVKCLDISPGAVEVMKRQGIEAELVDVMKYNTGEYDTVLLLMNGIGLAGTLAGLLRLLKHLNKLLKTGGQILLDSTDVAYLYEEVGMSMDKGYYGEVKYQMEYGDIIGPVFKWLYVDFTTLSSYAEKAGFHAKLLFENDDFSYLARLRKL